MKQLFITNFLLIAILFPFTINAQTDIKPTWEPQVAGRFYPATESVLKDQINIFFKNVPKQTINGKPIAVISPHAGYQYSGQVAAFVYNAIKNCGFNRVIVLAFPHRSPKPYRGV
ncbi:MAG: AmmeMemoRadiSam system protein B [Planctomycetes bacterium RIFCSPHIGHO2_12_39_6]|nr:MAG: AmmeMemoRadiSam system protein B [Planctomycetes bacterium RIFCSPHIGHO2_12_39_6]